MKIYYVRHGEPTYDKYDSLTENGKYQVEEISKYLSQIPFKLAFISPVRRTYRSAEPTLKKLHIGCEVLDFASEDFAWFRLNEKYENRYRWMFEIPPYIDIFKKYEDCPNSKFFKDKIIKKTNFKLIQNRVDKGIDEWMKKLGFVHNRKTKKYIAKDVKEQQVILFAHQGISTFIFSSLLDESYSKFVSHHALLDCASISIFNIDEESGNISLEEYNLIKY